jgi:hypothetical protein
MKYKLNQWQLLCLMLFIGLFVQANCYNADLQDQDKIITQIQQTQQEPSNRITLEGAYTLIRTTEDYIYLNSLEIDREQWEHATRHTDINGVTWYEIIEDGYIKVYAEGHVMPDSIHWYAPY